MSSYKKALSMDNSRAHTKLNRGPCTVLALIVLFDFSCYFIMHAAVTSLPDDGERTKRVQFKRTDVLVTDGPFGVCGLGSKFPQHPKVSAGCGRASNVDFSFFTTC